MVSRKLAARMECRLMMLATNNIFSPANGKPLATPSQDIVLGCYYLTMARPGAKGEGRSFASVEEIYHAMEAGEVQILTPIFLRHSGSLIDLSKQYDTQAVLHSDLQEV